MDVPTDRQTDKTTTHECRHAHAYTLADLRSVSQLSERLSKSTRPSLEARPRAFELHAYVLARRLRTMYSH